jgi:hypothetical protein
MEIDPKELVEKLGGDGKVATMTHEQRADALEDFQTQKLNAAVSETESQNIPPSRNWTISPTNANTAGAKASSLPTQLTATNLRNTAGQP